MFQYTTAIKKLRKLKKRKRVVPGGTSASKTFGILALLIDQAAKEPNLEISVVSESVPHLRRGALKDFLKIMKSTNRYRDQNYNRTLLTYRFVNGSYIEFFSADQEEKIRGARRNILYMNECNNMRFDIYHQLSIRTSGDIWLDFNPSNEFWAHTELPPSKDTEWLTLTYKDNEALPQSIVDDIEQAKEKAKDSEYWSNWWKVYGLGQLGTLQGVVFDNWDTIESIPSNARLIGYGLDFGYTNDPASVVGLYKFNNDIVFDEIVYSTGLLNTDLSDVLKNNGVNSYDEIIADSAEPKSIDELNRLGWRVYGCTKGNDSINYGINIIQQHKFKVTQRSTNLIKELRHYMWDSDRSGKTLNKPIDAWNHAIDACRYIAMEKLGSKKGSSGTSVIGYAKRRRR